MFKSTNSKSRLRASRKGAASVELAVCLPVILLLAIGSMEAANMIFLRQAMVQSAYETVKETIRFDGEQSIGVQRGNEVLAARNIQGATISVSPNVDENTPRGTLVTVTVEAPSDAKSIIPFGPFQGRTLQVSATMQKE